MRGERPRLAEACRVRIELGEHASPELEIPLHRPVDHAVYHALDRLRGILDDLRAEAILDRIPVAEEVRVTDSDRPLEPRSAPALHLVEHVSHFEEVPLGQFFATEDIGSREYRPAVLPLIVGTALVGFYLTYMAYRNLAGGRSSPDGALGGW